LAIFIIALALRLLYLIDYRKSEVYPVLPYSDGHSYLAWAKDIASGEIIGNKAFMKWPFYAYFLAAIFKFTSAGPAVVYLFQFFLGGLNCLLVYFIARHIFDRRTAFISGLCCAGYGLFIFYEGLLIYTSLSLFLNSLLFLYLLYIRAEPDNKKLFLAGILLGIAVITQANIIIFGVLALAWILIQTGKGFTRIWRGFLLFIFSLSLIIGLVTFRNYMLEKDLVLITGNLGLNFYCGNSPKSSGLFYCPREITPTQDGMFRDARIIAQLASGKATPLKTSQVSAFWIKQAFVFIKDKPVEYARLFLRKIAFTFSPQEFVHDIEYHYIRERIRIFRFLFMDLRFILPFSILGMFFGMRRFKDTVFLYLVIATLSLSIAIFFVSARYRIMLAPFLIIFAAYALVNVWDTLKEGRYLKLSFIFVFLALVIFLAFNNRLGGNNQAVRSSEKDSNFLYHLEKAKRYLGAENYKSALDELKKAGSIEQHNQLVALTYGAAYYQIGDLKAAEDKFKEAVSISPIYVDAYYNLGLLYNRMGRYSEAVEALKKGLSFDGEDPGMHFELGRAYKARGEFVSARNEFSLALAKINRWRLTEKRLIEAELRGITQ